MSSTIRENAIMVNIGNNYHKKNKQIQIFPDHINFLNKCNLFRKNGPHIIGKDGIYYSHRTGASDHIEMCSNKFWNNGIYYSCETHGPYLIRKCEIRNNNINHPSRIVCTKNGFIVEYEKRGLRYT